MSEPAAQSCASAQHVTEQGHYQSSLKTKEWLNSKEAAQFLGLSERSLFNLTSNGKVPNYKFGRRNRYRLNELRELLLAQPRGAIYGHKT